MIPKFSIGVILFNGFEVLDVFGPLEMYGMAPETFDIFTVGENIGTIASRQGPKCLIEHELSEEIQYDILLIPGGLGTRKEVSNEILLDWIKKQSTDAKYVTSVCTGSALLARTGLLDRMRATTNKIAFDWVTSQGINVHWQRQARWVEDGRFFTSSGVSAGIDMTLAIIGKILGVHVAEQIAVSTEYEWHSDSSWDPFAKINGLV